MENVNYFLEWISNPSNFFNVISWVNIIVVWIAANMVASRQGNLFGAHVLYSATNIFLIAFNAYYQHYGIIVMYVLLLQSSLRGCITYMPKREVRKLPFGLRFLQRS
jgi:hypothetical protein